MMRRASFMVREVRDSLGFEDRANFDSGGLHFLGSTTQIIR